MLRPTKHSHPDRTVVALALRLVERLRSQRVDSFDTLRSFARQSVCGGDVLFLPAVSVLYLLGVLVYHAKNDTFEFVGDRNAI